MPFRLPGAEVDQWSHDEAAQSRHADLDPERQSVMENQNVLGVAVETVLGGPDGKAEEEGAVAGQNTNENGHQGEIDVLVQMYFTQNMEDLLGVFFRHCSSIADSRLTTD